MCFLAFGRESSGTQLRHSSIVFALVLALSTAAGSALAQSPESVTPQQKGPEVQALNQEPAKTQALPTEGTDEDKAYVLQRGDELEIKAFNMPELAQTVTIRPDGRISLVLLNDVEAAGLTATQLSEALSALYSQHFREPRVTVIVKNFTNRSVFVGGEVSRPGVIPLSDKLTILGAVLYSGGFKDTAKLREVVLLRDSGKGGPLIMRVNLDEVVKEGKRDITLKPFDIVYVPKSKIAKLDQFVDRYIKQVLPISVFMGFNYVLGRQVF